MRNTQLASVIIPVFNDAAGVAKTLDGISRQSWPTSRIEVIIVDNGSREPVILHSDYPFCVRVIRCETPGSYAARNAGAAFAKGEILAFTDADCVPCEHWLRRGISSLICGQGQWLVGGNVLFTPVDSPTGIALYQITVGFGQETNINERAFSATANLFCTREQFEIVGRFDERLLSAGDREWCWRARTKGINLIFEPDSIVVTAPRTSWSSAIRQARRVAAGRLHLLEHGLAHAGERGLDPHRNIRESLSWLIQQDQLGAREKISTLIAAIVLKSVSIMETVRVRLGFQAERR